LMGQATSSLRCRDLPGYHDLHHSLASHCMVTMARGSTYVVGGDSGVICSRSSNLQWSRRRPQGIELSYVSLL
jgi:hypothetical protein